MATEVSNCVRARLTGLLIPRPPHLVGSASSDLTVPFGVSKPVRAGCGVNHGLHQCEEVAD